MAAPQDGDIHKVVDGFVYVEKRKKSMLVHMTTIQHCTLHSLMLDRVLLHCFGGRESLKVLLINTALGKVDAANK